MGLTTNGKRFSKTTPQLFNEVCNLFFSPFFDVPRCDMRKKPLVSSTHCINRATQPLADSPMTHAYSLRTPIRRLAAAGLIAQAFLLGTFPSWAEVVPPESAIGAAPPASRRLLLNPMEEGGVSNLGRWKL